MKSFTMVNGNRPLCGAWRCGLFLQMVIAGVSRLGRGRVGDGETLETAALRAGEHAAEYAALLRPTRAGMEEIT